MSAEQQKKFSLNIGLVVGMLADGYLRIVNGEDGNLFLHIAIFLGVTLIASGAVYGLTCLWNRFFSKKK